MSTEPGFKEPSAIVIEAVSPVVECGRYAVKRIVGDVVLVTATVFKDGHDMLAAAVQYRSDSDEDWLESPMAHAGYDRWSGHFQVDSNERYRFVIEAWFDRFGTWRRDMRKRLDAGQDVSIETREGEAMLRDAAKRADGGDRTRIERFVHRIARAGDPSTAAQVLLNDDLAALMSRWQPRELATRTEAFDVWVDRPRARFASWYEFFPRSEGAAPGRSGTFRAAEERLPGIAAMGFDVVYLPPIHPIGRTARKGPNNALFAGPDDPGSPWAIGNEAGGHTAVEPSLGTLDDFDRFVARARSLGMEVALDFAVQCSPDHPWVREHPEWFFHRVDGTIKYAENPPKKYQDIYPLNFWGPHREALWRELLAVLEFWIAHGVKTFRVDNPHTKPPVMWEWLIARVREKHPDVIFLSEAFTIAHMMRRLAKIGFTQSYTYFTWKNSKWELTEYAHELFESEMREYFRASLWTNTPDILHAFLQKHRRPAFKLRALLASTMSPLWGMYSGYELMEHVPVREGSEEYIDSEKYQYKPRDWTQPDSLVPFITRLNRARRENRALQLYDNLRLVHADDANVLAYVRATPDRSNVVLVVANLDPTATHASDLWIDPAELGVGADESYSVRDVITDEVFAWRGGKNWVRLDPFVQPAHVLVVQRGPGH